MRHRGALIVIAAVLAIAGTVGVYSYLKGADSRALADKQATSVIIAQKRIPAGTTIAKIKSGGYVRSDKVPASARPAGALLALDEVAGTDVSLADVPSGQVVLESMFGKREPTTSGLKIPDGKLAVSITVATDADVAGYVQPGSEVAVFDTYMLLEKGPAGAKQGGKPEDDWATTLLLPRVPVLAVSQGPPNGDAKATAAQMLVVTVAVDQADAERLIHVRQTGNLYLGLLTSRSVTAPTPGVDNQGKLGVLFDLSSNRTRTAAR
jgi:pilus assembly protein CpaB